MAIYFESYPKFTELGRRTIYLKWFRAGGSTVALRMACYPYTLYTHQEITDMLWYIFRIYVMLCLPFYPSELNAFCSTRSCFGSLSQSLALQTYDLISLIIDLPDTLRYSPYCLNSPAMPLYLLNYFCTFMTGPGLTLFDLLILGWIVPLILRRRSWCF